MFRVGLRAGRTLSQYFVLPLYICPEQNFPTVVNHHDNMDSKTVTLFSFAFEQNPRINFSNLEDLKFEAEFVKHPDYDHLFKHCLIPINKHTNSHTDHIHVAGNCHGCLAADTTLKQCRPGGHCQKVKCWLKLATSWYYTEIFDNFIERQNIIN